MNEEVENIILMGGLILFTLGLCFLIDKLSAIHEQLKRIADKPARDLYISGCDVRQYERLTDDVASNNDRFK